MLHLTSPMMSLVLSIQMRASGYWASRFRSLALYSASGRGWNIRFIACMTRIASGSAVGPTERPHRLHRARPVARTYVLDVRARSIVQLLLQAAHPRLRHRSEVSNLNAKVCRGHVIPPVPYAVIQECVGVNQVRAPHEGQADGDPSSGHRVRREYISKCSIDWTTVFILPTKAIPCPAFTGVLVLMSPFTCGISP